MLERVKSLDSSSRQLWQRARGGEKIPYRTFARGVFSWPIRAPIVTLADQVLVSGCNFVGTALIARGLGLESFGWYTLIWIAVLFASSLQLGMIVSPMMSIGAKQHDRDADRYFGVVVIHEMIFSCLAAVAIYIVVIWMALPSGTPAIVPLAAGAAGGAYLAQDFTRRCLFARLCAHAVFITDAVNQLTKLALIAWIWRGRALDIETTFWVLAASAAVSVATGSLFSGTLHFDKKQFWPITKRQWRSARWLTGTAIMQWATSNSPFVITGSLLGPAAVGALRAATTILGVINISREAIENILPQRAGRALATGGPPALRSLLIATALLSMGFGVLVVLALSVFGGNVLKLVYGPGFAQYGFVVGLLSLAFPLWLLNLTLICGFRALERTMPVFAAASAATALNLLLMYPAVLVFGVSGAIGVMVASDFLVAMILLYRIQKDFATATRAIAAE
jgi:O-antigen/teichoic acid export membrane protein